MLRILLTGGGTLGSVSPLVAIHDQFTDADYLFIGTNNGPERQFVTARGIRFRAIAAAKLRRYLSIQNVLDFFKFPVAFFQSLRIIASYRPDVVLTAGGFVAVPVALAARAVRVPVFIHQQDVRLGLANKIMMHVATAITTTFEDQKKLFGLRSVQWVGNPMRIFPPATYPEKKKILILGGSSGAQGLNATVAPILPQLADDYEIEHVLGKRNFFQRLTDVKNYTPIDFLGDGYSKAVQEAALVITRAGMATLTELAHYRKAVMIIPIPGSHQVNNAEFLVSQDAARSVAQGESGELLKETQRLLSNRGERQQLGQKLHALFPENALAAYRDLIVRTVPASARRRTPFVHCIGIGGIGVSALVPYFQERGYRVSGSDVSPSTITRRLEKNGIMIHYGHDKRNVPRDAAMVIYSSAVPATNEELLAARRRQLPVYSYNEYLGLLSTRLRTIAISGTHGKTTTTALTGFLLEQAGYDPSVIVGSLIPQFGNRNYRHGNGNALVLEADEYRAHMLLLKPSVIVINNLEADHLDFYHTVSDIKDAFRKFTMSLPADGTLIKNADDPALLDLSGPTTITFGLSPKADIRAENVVIKGREQQFSVFRGSRHLGDVSIKLPGSFNVSNSLAAIAVCLQLGASFRSLQKPLSEFSGSWRRFELVGSYRSCPVYSDYAHHPTAIRLTLKAIREFYPDKKILLAYQPHSYDRTEKLLKEFSTAFDGADSLILTDIYDVVGRDHAHGITSKHLFESIKHAHASYAPGLEDVRKMIEYLCTPDSLIVIMGAGTIDSLARSLVSRS